MKININNYEEYFLLYADNELSVEDMQEVELFIKENPALREEFDHIMQTIVSADTTIELDKSKLFRRQSSFEARNHEENFVLYHDGELSRVEEEQAKELIEQDIDLRSQFELIGKAKLEPDKAIVFPNKQVLYKKERDRVIPIWGWRAAAAVIIGIGLWGGYKYFEKPANVEPQVVKQNEVVVPKTNNLPVPEHKQEIATQEKKTPPAHFATNNKGSDNNLPIVRVKHEDNQAQNSQKPEQKDINNLKYNHKDLVNTMRDVQKSINDALKGLDNLNGNLDKVNTKKSTQDNPNDYKVTQAAYSENASDNSSNNDDYSFYNVPKKEFNKSKLSVILKQTKRIVVRNLFHKKSKDSDEQQ